MTNAASLHLLICASAIASGMIGALTDLRSRRIPNWLTSSTTLFGLLLHLMVGGLKEGASSLLGMLFCGSVFLVLYLAGGMGAGDVKLIAAEASLLGLPLSGPLLLYTVLAGGVMGIALAVQRGKVRSTLSNVLQLTLHHSRNGLQPHPDLNVHSKGGLRLPYAVAIFSGCILAVYLQPSFGWSL